MDLTQSKKRFADDMIYVARLTLQLADRLHALNLAFNGAGFNAGAANAYQDSDFDGTPNAHLTAAKVEGAMFVIGQADNLIGTGQRQSLLKVIAGGQP